MDRNHFKAAKWLAIALGLACTLLLFVALPAGVRSAGPDLPPRVPTPTPVPTPVPPVELPGAYIELRVRSSGSGLTARWQEVWTVVQWQDTRQRWHDVEGWRGHLDRLQAGAGLKTWWLAEDLFGQGPFRWLVLPAAGSPSPTTSDPFYLPLSAGQTAIVEVVIEP